MSCKCSAWRCCLCAALYDRGMTPALMNMKKRSGGVGTRALVKDPEHIAWIAKASKPASEEGKGWVMSVCTGAGLLAQAGVLNHRSATTNKRAFTWAQSLVPQANINWIKQARYGQPIHNLTLTLPMQLSCRIRHDIVHLMQYIKAVTAMHHCLLLLQAI